MAVGIQHNLDLTIAYVAREMTACSGVCRGVRMRQQCFNACERGAVPLFANPPREEIDGAQAFSYFSEGGPFGVWLWCFVQIQ